MYFPQKRLLALLLAALTFISLFTACAGNTDRQTNGTATSADAITDAVNDAGTEKIVYKADIPEGTDYSGYEFKIHTYGVTDVVWFDVDFCAEEENGDILNDAAYRRMRSVEEMLNVKIADYPTGYFGDATDLKKSVMAQASAYDIAFVNMRSAASISQSGYCVNLKSMDTLATDAAWWDQNAVSDLSIDGKLYMITGDIETMYKKSIGVILFNKQFIDDYNLDDPYQLVKDNEWTIDRMSEMAKGVSKDLDGNNVYDKNDQYGFLYYSDVIALGIIGGGVNFVTKDNEDLPALTFYSDRTVSIFEKYTSLFYNKGTSYIDNNEDVLKPMFISNQALFDFNEFHAIEQLRQMDTDFGILPIPLLDSSQESYYHTINPYVGSVLCVPIDNSDLDRTGYILDALGAESKNELTPAYYEVYLKTKGARDDDSEAIIDLVLGTLKYDLGYMYNWGNIGSFTLDTVNAKSSDLSSKYGKIEKTVEKELAKAVLAYQEL